MKNDIASLTKRLNLLETKSEEMRTWSDVVKSVPSDLTDCKVKITELQARYNEVVSAEADSGNTLSSSQLK